MTEEVVKTILADAIRVLRLMPCSCQYNVPYAGGHVKQEVTKRCSRCRVIQEYEAMHETQSNAEG